MRAEQFGPGSRSHTNTTREHQTFKEEVYKEDGTMRDAQPSDSVKKTCVCGMMNSIYLIGYA